MSKKRIGIMTECVCDLPQKLIDDLGIEIAYFTVRTDTGVFMDKKEITSDNLISYMNEERPLAVSNAPSIEVYKHKFQKMLEKYERVIHITISSGVSVAFEHASKAVLEMECGDRITVIDSKHLSSGMGLVVLRAANMVRSGKDMDRIVEELTEYRERVCTSFITQDLRCLYNKKLVSKFVFRFCTALNIFPVLRMKNGRLSFGGVKIGAYDNAARRYVRSALRHTSDIDKNCCYLTHAGCSTKRIGMLTEEIGKCCEFQKVNVMNASATITSNCGPNAFGVLFVKQV